MTGMLFDRGLVFECASCWMNFLVEAFLESYCETGGHFLVEREFWWSSSLPLGESTLKEYTMDEVFDKSFFAGDLFW